jgi:hypothetical protein
VSTIRSSTCLVLGALVILPVGCAKPRDTTPKPIAQKEEIPDLLKRLKEAQAPLARRAFLNQLASLGADANTPEVLTTLDEVRKKVSPAERQLVDQTIAKIKGTAPPAGDAKK